MAGPFTSGHKVFNTDLNPMLLGWIDFVWFGLTLAYVSADAPTFVFSINADVTAVVEPGMRIKLTQTTDKFFIVTAVGAYAAGVTPITVYGGTDYTLANASISAGAFSTHKKPFGFNASPLKWTEQLTDTVTRTASTPTSGTWFNPGSPNQVFPIGAWNVEFAGVLLGTKTGTEMDVYSSLSTANNSESDTHFTSYVDTAAAGATQVFTGVPFSRRKTLLLAAKTTYYPVIKTGQGSSSSIQFTNAAAPLIVRAVCAYL